MDAPDDAGNPARRAFIGQALKLGAAAMVGTAALPSEALSQAEVPAKGAQALAVLPELPSHVFVEQNGNRLEKATKEGSRFTSGQTVVNLLATSGGQEVRVTCPSGTMSRVVLRWETIFPGETLFLGDHWERGYGDLQWRFLQPERVMPWYFAAHHAASGRTFWLRRENPTCRVLFLDGGWLRHLTLAGLP